MSLHYQINTEMEMLKLIPAYKDYLWGGTRLKEEYGKQTDLPILAESWEFSVHDAGLSRIAGTDLTLKEYAEKNRSCLGKQKDIHILVKFIDADRDLSVQVHPDEEYARKNEHEHGKTECWSVMDAKEGAVISYGMKQEMSRQEFQDSIADGTIMEKINVVPVKKGDYVLVEPGTVHAIGKGCLIVEIQQSSDLTYRIYDYDRRDSKGQLRPLHIDKALEVVNLQKPQHLIKNTNGLYSKVADCDIFSADYIPVNSEIKLQGSPDSYMVLVFVSGEGQVSFGKDGQTFKKGDTYFIPASDETVTVKGNCELISVRVK